MTCQIQECKHEHGPATHTADCSDVNMGRVPICDDHAAVLRNMDENYPSKDGHRYDVQPLDTR